MAADEAHKSTAVSLTADLVAAFVSSNSLPVAELPALIHSVHSTLTRIATGAVEPPALPAPTPAVPARKSITPDYLICLDDGKRFKSLRRHLQKLGMTPEQYREKWGLPADYPMVAPSYSAVRSELARKIDLGHMQKGRATAAEPAKEQTRRLRKATA